LVGGSVVPVEVMTRAQWVEANVESFRFLMNPLASKFGMAGEVPLPEQAAQVLRQIGGIFLGLQTGFVLGYLAQHVMGQYEVPLFAPAAPRLLYGLPNL